MQQRFAKYEGAGTASIRIDTRNGASRPDARLVAGLGDRHFGIGADGLMTLSVTPDGVCTMHYYNADGSEGEMCGYGPRCFALFAEHLGIQGPVKRFRATDGPHTAHVRRTGPLTGEVEVAMTDVAQITDGDGWWALNTGVPHYVEFVRGVETVDVAGRGRGSRAAGERFGLHAPLVGPHAERAGARDLDEVDVRALREAGRVAADGAAAAIVTHHALQHDRTDYEIAVPGGLLHVRFTHRPATRQYTDIRLEGPARRVFEGLFDTENL